MSDIVLHDVPEELRRKLEERARAHSRSLSDEAESLLEGVLSTPPAPDQWSKPRLGTLLATLIPPEFRGTDFVDLRDYSVRPPPTFE